MTHREKVAHLSEALRRRGVRGITVAPPLFRFLWLVGLRVPPPHFLGFFRLALWTGVPFALLFALLGAVLAPRPYGNRFDPPLVAAAVGGLLFGVATAAYYRLAARRLGLGAWEDYPPVGRGGGVSECRA